MKISLLLTGALLLAASTFCSGGAAHAQERSFPRVGPDAELFIPFSAKTRNRFGSAISGIGLGFGDTRVRKGARISPDISVLSAKDGGDKATLFIAGAQYVRPFSDDIDSKKNVPFYGVGVNALYGSVDVNDEDNDGRNFGFGGSVFIGTSVGRRAVVEARLRALSSVEGYNFSGFTLSAGLRF